MAVPNQLLQGLPHGRLPTASLRAYSALPFDGLMQGLVALHGPARCHRGLQFHDSETGNAGAISVSAVIIWSAPVIGGRAITVVSGRIATVVAMAGSVIPISRAVSVYVRS